MKKLLQLGLILTGAAAFTMTAANAKCGGSQVAPETVKCQSGKCGAAMKEKMKAEGKEMKCQSGKCGEGKKEEMKKEMKEKMKGKCGQGKCGS